MTLIPEPSPSLTLEQRLKELKRLADLEQAEASKFTDCREYEHNVIRMHYIREIVELEAQNVQATAR